MDKRIIWPVDAQEEVDKIQRNVVRTLKVLTRAMDSKLEIEPVYVLPADYVLTDEYNFMPPVDLRTHARKALEIKLAKVDVPGLLVPKILEDPVYTNAQTAKTLLEYAQQTHTDLIVVGTHARRGISRLFLGSFTESLILHSPAPVLTVCPNTKPLHRFSHIIFPTKFEHESLGIFSRVLEFAQGCGARISIFHQIPRPLLLVSGPELLRTQRDVLMGERKEAHQNSKEFLHLAKGTGVEVSVHVLLSEVPVGESIIKYARKRGAELIAMAARSGRVAAALTGSITRQVVRASPFPVWVLREQAVGALTRKTAS